MTKISAHGAGVDTSISKAPSTASYRASLLPTMFVAFVLISGTLLLNNMTMTRQLQKQDAEIDQLNGYISTHINGASESSSHFIALTPFSRMMDMSDAPSIPQLMRAAHRRSTSLFSQWHEVTLQRLLDFSNRQTQATIQEDKSAFHTTSDQAPLSPLIDEEEQYASMIKTHDNLVHSLAFPEHSLSGNRLKDRAICDPTVQQYSGYLSKKTSTSKKHFFYWAFESRHDPAKDPLILWLNGGPGCSSLTGLFMELGPCSVNKAGNETIWNPHSWTSNATVIFLDQPMGVGFSYGSPRVRSTYTAAEDVYAFLQLFYKLYPKFASVDFHIAGESYTGHFIPAIGYQILQHNQKKFESNVHLATHASELIQIPFKSIMIGNGLTDPLTQYRYYPEMACNNSYSPVLSDKQCQAMENAFPSCEKRIKKCYKSMGTFDCVIAMQACNMAMIAPYVATGQNVYDVRAKCGKRPLCYEILESIQTYLNRADVQQAIKAVPTKYQGCNMSVNLFFGTTGDWMKPFYGFVGSLLDAGIDALIYAGDADFICNWLGNRAWTLTLPWLGQKAFNAMPEKTWIDSSSGKASGVVREYRSSPSATAPIPNRLGHFTFLRVFGAGHMVPYDQPASSLDMLNRWIQEKSFIANTTDVT